MNKKYLTFGILGLFALALVSAGIMAYYGEVWTTVDVTQPISFFVGDSDSTGWIATENVPCDAGETCIGLNAYRVVNDGSSDRLVSLTTTGNVGNGVDVSYVGMLELTKKDPSAWTVIDDMGQGVLYYSITGEEMGYNLEATDLEASTVYTLIYYLDSGATDPVTGKPWNMNSAITIGSGTSDTDGNLVLEGMKEFDSDLPFDSDYNKNPNEGDSYCDGDNGYDYYLHCSGAKIWLITGEVSNNNWNPEDWLFEKEDLAHYFDNTEGEIVVPAGSFIEFYPQFSVDSMATEGDYVIYTTVNPAE